MPMSVELGFSCAEFIAASSTNGNPEVVVPLHQATMGSVFCLPTIPGAITVALADSSDENQNAALELGGTLKDT